MSPLFHLLTEGAQVNKWALDGPSSNRGIMQGGPFQYTRGTNNNNDSLKVFLQDGSSPVNCITNRLQFV